MLSLLKHEVCYGLITHGRTLWSPPRCIVLRISAARQCSGEVPEDIPYYTPTELDSSTTFILNADLTGNLLTDWPDQREGEER